MMCFIACEPCLHLFSDSAVLDFLDLCLWGMRQYWIDSDRWWLAWVCFRLFVMGALSGEDASTAARPTCGKKSLTLATALRSAVATVLSWMHSVCGSLVATTVWPQAVPSHIKRCFCGSSDLVPRWLLLRWLALLWRGGTTAERERFCPVQV